MVPEPFPEYSGTSVLTMEFFDGVPIDDLGAVAELGVDPAPLVEEVVRAFFATAVRWGSFHGDVHAGNMLLLRDGRIGIIDWGIVGRLDAGTHQFFLRVLAGALGDETAWPEVAAHLSATYGPAIKEAVGLDDAGLSEFVRALVEPTLNRPFGEVSLAAVFQLTQRQIARAQGIEVHRRTVSGIVHQLRAQRRLRRMVDASGGVMSDFDRGTFLLGKQLLYFERYGRLFLADVPILRDRCFFAELLAGAPGAGPRPPGGGASPGGVRALPRKTEMCSTSGRQAADRGASDADASGAADAMWKGGPMADTDAEVLTDAHVLDYPYSRSVGPVLGAFLTALRDGRILGATGSDGSVVVPPTEYDPLTAEPTGELVEVGPGGTVASWAWVVDPLPKHPLDRPFAWALVRLDGATTSLLHVVDAGGPERGPHRHAGGRRLRGREERIGRMQDIRAFVPETGGER